jgi:hypothetical protein
LRKPHLSLLKSRRDNGVALTCVAIAGQAGIG